MRILIESVAFLAQQNIAFRGHVEHTDDVSSASDINRGNFLELVSLRCKDSTFLRDRLEKLKDKNKHQYLHSDYQNELIDLLAKYTRNRIVREINCNENGGIYYGIICDETSDISRTEQLSLVISYVDSKGQKRESFLDFLEAESTTGEDLFELIVGGLRKLGLDVTRIVGMGFDGASNMLGGTKGVAARFKEVAPMSVYVHCYAHLLNLAVKSTLSDVPLLRDTLGTVQQLYVFLEASPKRHSLFQKVDISEDGAFVRTLKNLSATRWSANWEAVRAVNDEMFRIIKCLIELRKDRDAKISSTAKALLINILDFEFVFGLHLLKIILPSTSKLSSFIQSTTIDVRKVLLLLPAEGPGKKNQENKAYSPN